MSAKLKVGDTVICKYYNTPDKRFYGETFQAVIIENRQGAYPYNPPRDYAVQRADDGRIVTLDRREILKRIKQG